MLMRERDLLEGVRERARPQLLYGITERVVTHSGNVYITINVDSDLRPFEVFLRIGRSDSVEQAHLEGLARVVSYCLRLGGDPIAIMNNLEGITSEPIWSDGELIRSAEDAVGKTLRKLLAGEYEEMLLSMRARDGVEAGAYQRRLPAIVERVEDSRSSPAVPVQSSGGGGGHWAVCPKCQGRAIPTEGCLHCLDCGYEKCS